MKKIIVALMSFIMTVVAVSGQTVKDTTINISMGCGVESDIYKTIMRSKEANRLNGISDPNKIQIGDLLTFKFADGFDTTYRVTAGESQWKIVRGMLATMPASSRNCGGLSNHAASASSCATAETR